MPIPSGTLLFVTLRLRLLALLPRRLRGSPLLIHAKLSCQPFLRKDLMATQGMAVGGGRGVESKQLRDLTPQVQHWSQPLKATRHAEDGDPSASGSLVNTAPVRNCSVEAASERDSRGVTDRELHCHDGVDAPASESSRSSGKQILLSSPPR